MSLAMGVAWAGPVRSEADRCDSGFERGDGGDWSGPWGGGTDGGEGRGEIVTDKPGEFVRSGRRAVRMTVWDNGSSNAMAWAFLAEKHVCKPGARIRAGAHFYASSLHEPLPKQAVAQLRVEYYYDRSCESQIPTHVKLSEPFSLQAGSPADTWQAVELNDRVPPGATCLKFTILVLADQPGATPGTVWVDDVFIEQARGSGRSHADGGETGDVVAQAHWWQRLCR
jgi:hypothetical protein